MYRATRNNLTHQPHASRRRGLTLIEMLVACLILSLVVAVLVGVSSTVVLSAREQTTDDIQGKVLVALELYYQSNHAYPPGGNESDTLDMGESSARLLDTLRNCEKASKILDKLPAGAIEQDETGREILLDGFARHMRYLQREEKNSEEKNHSVPMLKSDGRDLWDRSDDRFRTVERQTTARPPRETRSPT